MNIDDELRRLFADERLELAVRPGAEQRIVAGARRIRRRRYAAVTAAAVVAVVAIGGGIALAGPGGQGSLPPAVSTTDPVPTTSPAPPSTTTRPPASTKPTTTSPPAAAPGEIEKGKVGDTPASPAGHEDFPVIGPDSFGPLTLGMSADDALATGLLGEVVAEDGACSRYAATFGGNVLLSKKLGLVRVGVTSPVATPAGIHLGSTVAEVRAAYPDAWDYRMGLKAGNFSFYVGGSNPAYEAWPATSPVVRIDITIESDCALAL